MNFGPVNIVGKYAKGKTCIADLAPLQIINKFRWHVNVYGYAYVTLKDEFGRNKNSLYLHRVIMGAQCPITGDRLTELEVDHINGDTLDNRVENLRLATHTHNMQNRKMHKNNTSGVRGLSSFEKKGKRYWYGRVYAGGKCYQKTSLDRGTVESWLEKTRSKLHGEFNRD